MPPRPKPSRPISTEADKLTRRGPGRPPRPPAPGTKAEDPPGGAKPLAPPAQPRVIILWNGIAVAIKAVADPLYKRLGAECPPVEVWQAFLEAWDRVVLYYVPGLQTSPLLPAIVMSAVVAAPVLAVLQKRQAEQAKAEAATKAAAAAGFSTEQSPA